MAWPENDRYFDSVRRAKERLSEYVDGTFSLFNHRHDAPQQERSFVEQVTEDAARLAAEQPPAYERFSVIETDDATPSGTDIRDGNLMLTARASVRPFPASGRPRIIWSRSERRSAKRKRQNGYMWSSPGTPRRSGAAAVRTCFNCRSRYRWHTPDHRWTAV